MLIASCRGNVKIPELSLDHAKKISTSAERLDRFLALTHQNHVSGDHVVEILRKAASTDVVTAARITPTAFA